MKIFVVGSIELADKIIKIADKIEKSGHQTEIPYTAAKIKKGEITLKGFKKLKKANNSDHIFRQQTEEDLIERCYNRIKKSDAILVVNFTKNGIKNYIGGNVLMELGFAYVLGKSIYLYNPVPKMSYMDEILAVKPIVLNGNLNNIVH